MILTSLDLAAALGPAAGPPPSPAPDLCGHCTLCLDACPTGALVEPYVLDARRCISYLTIELRGAIPEEFRPAMGWQVFGCDICQDVCPWNRAAPSASLPGFVVKAAPAESAGEKKPAPREAPELLWLLSLTEDDFRAAFRGSAVRRAKWRGLVRNACVAAGNVLRGSGSAGAPQRAALLNKLAQLADSADALIAEHARWALARQSAPENREPSPAAATAPPPRAASRGSEAASRGDFIPS